MKKIIAVILCVVMQTSVFAAVPLPGTYQCKSVEVGTNRVYTGTMVLTKTGQTYTSHSVFNDGSSYKGTTIYNPKKQMLASAAINTDNKSEIGVSLSTIQKDGSLNVKWTYLNRHDVANAHCTKVKDIAA